MAVDSVLRLSSAANPLVKAVRKAARRGRATEDGLWLAESPHLLEEARRSEVELAAVLLAEAAADTVRELAQSCEAPLRLISDKLFAELATTEHSQGVIALVRPPEWTLKGILDRQGPVVVLDRLGDPGNVGAIARSAEAFGAAGLALTRGSAHPANPKALRASAGAFFRLPFVSGADPGPLVEECKAAGRALLAACAHDGRSIREAPLDNAAIVIGSEAHGVESALKDAAEAVHIPTVRVESLNAAMAATVILYEAAG